MPVGSFYNIPDSSTRAMQAYGQAGQAYSQMMKDVDKPGHTAGGAITNAAGGAVTGAMLAGEGLKIGALTGGPAGAVIGGLLGLGAYLLS